jgi:hypothetical protein
VTARPAEGRAGGRAGAHRAALALVVPGFLFLWAERAGAGPHSPLWFAELPAHLLLVLALLLPALGRPAPFARIAKGRGAAFVALSWAFGMAYELSLTVDGSGIGGVHPDTRASFLLAQGDYLPIALASLAAAHLLCADLPAMVWLALGMSLTEGLLFTGALAQVIASPAWPWAPLVLSYFALAYAGFVALPLAFLAPEAGHAARARPRAGWPALVAVGLAAGFAVRLLWGLVLAPLISAAFDLPPNPL